MARMTDIDALLEEVVKIQASGGDAEKRVGEIILAITNTPTVEIVRCKECKHWHEKTGWCYHHSHFVGAEGEACHPWESTDWKMFDAEDFCSYGERKTDGI